jgi:hypothetical protein
LRGCLVFSGEDRSDAYNHKRQPNKHPAFEHCTDDSAITPPLRHEPQDIYATAILVTPTGAPTRKSRTSVSVDDQASGGVLAPLPGIEIHSRNVPIHVQFWAIEGTADARWLSHSTPPFRRQALRIVSPTSASRDSCCLLPWHGSKAKVLSHLIFPQPVQSPWHMPGRQCHPPLLAQAFYPSLHV